MNFLRSNAHVFGKVTTSGTIVKQNDVVIGGGEIAGVPVELTLRAEGPIEAGRCSETVIDVEFDLRLTLDASGVYLVQDFCH